jgi:hypothetical protein
MFMTLGWALGFWGRSAQPFCMLISRGSSLQLIGKLWQFLDTCGILFLERLLERHSDIENQAEIQISRVLKVENIFFNRSNSSQAHFHFCYIPNPQYQVTRFVMDHFSYTFSFIQIDKQILQFQNISTRLKEVLAAPLLFMSFVTQNLIAF